MNTSIPETVKKISNVISFADVAHQTLEFDAAFEHSRLVLELVDTRWMQRLRNIRQTGNTNFVYMFAEHSRFGHSLGVAYLAILLMNHLEKYSPELVSPYKNAVAAAALLHDIGHVAPGSHLAEHVWGQDSIVRHESLTKKIIEQDPEIQGILNRYGENLSQQVIAILTEQNGVPHWTKEIISGGGWNADRGNWSIVDSAMCNVSYGRYNVSALIGAFCLSADLHLVLQESRLDALTHFFVARDSMYRQVYQHRTLQATDKLNEFVIRRVRDILPNEASEASAEKQLNDWAIFHDQPMLKVLLSRNYAEEVPLNCIYEMTEAWWLYHIHRWCFAKDKILRDLASRLRDRKLFKTIRLASGDYEANRELLNKAEEIAKSCGYDPSYYVAIINNKDKHRAKKEEIVKVLLDDGQILSAAEVEPLIRKIMEKSGNERVWLVAPSEVKEKLGRKR
ncbi:MAG: HD domain-containing protein [Deltaproteobacteria bacterium]|nr:HD domain-containing protein [Deltaproteobacteria bacterium]